MSMEGQPTVPEPPIVDENVENGVRRPLDGDFVPRARVGRRRGVVAVQPIERPTTTAGSSMVAATIAGLGVTMRHFFRNLFGRKDVVTVEYPDRRRVYPPRMRGLHRLMHREDGTLRCVACMLCPTICPAHCITVIAEDVGAEVRSPDEKRARVFEIDELRCVVCGLCVEACPVDAIRMDTGVHIPVVAQRSDAIFDAQMLASRGGPSKVREVVRSAGWQERRADMEAESDPNDMALEPHVH